MSVFEYELLKCEDCGKRLGYIHVCLKTFPPKALYRLYAGFPHQKIEKTALCESCFQKKAQIR
jgi:hypothetical protein